MTPGARSRQSKEEPRRRRRWMAAGLAASLVALVAAGGAGQPAEAPALPDNPLHGRLLFEGKHCNQCHGLAGGWSGVGPSLGEGRFRGSFLDLGAEMWNHVPGMSVQFEGKELAWPQVTEAEALELTAFLYFIDYLGRPGDAAAGRRVFASRGCPTCHAVGGKGGTTGPNLANLTGFASPLFVAQAIWNHGPSMLGSMHRAGIAPPVLKEGDLGDLSAFIRQAAEGGPREQVLLSPGNPNRGRTVYETRGCRDCHALHGQSGPDLRRSDLHRSAEAIAATMWNHALGMNASMVRQGIAWPHLTAEELADLIAFLYYLPFADLPGSAQRGAEVFASRSCASCHSGGKASGQRGPDLTGSPATRSPAALVAAMWNHAPVMKTAILGEGRPWPELSGQDLRDLLAYLKPTPDAL